MRTTVTLDPDAEALLRAAMRERGLSFKEALNLAIRAGFGPAASRRQRKYRLPTFQMGFRPEINLDKGIVLAAVVEDEEIARKLSLRK
jgi:hypothetical protein